MVRGNALSTGRLDQVKRELQRLRQGPALARPITVLRLSQQLRARLVGHPREDGDAVDEAVRVVAALRHLIERLSDHDRLYASVDFNLHVAHAYPTLTERQESLAGQLKCASKTIRRHADAALETLALLLISSNDPRASYRVEVPAGGPARGHDRIVHQNDTLSWQERLREFWQLSAHSRVDIVCSEIPEDERPYFASPNDRNYLRYAKFADLDSLVYVRTRLTQVLPLVTIRDFLPSEYYDTDVDRLIVIGGPPWNAKFREFLSQLPFFFEPHPLGEDDPLVIPQLESLTMGPRWTHEGMLIEDLAVFTRLTLAQGSTVFLLGGCLTLGVLVAAKCFLQGERGACNATYADESVGRRDFVLVTEAHRVGGIVDTPDLTTTHPLLLLARDGGDRFNVVVDNSGRYAGH